ncbi:MAG TPA: hypothetical protein VFN88_05465 [Caulobacteraceae bacterium]|nr:hypothetical protein [Caulobacteraceae bacterium]
MAPSDNKDGTAIWFGIVVGLVILVTVLIGALIIGPQRSSEGRGEIRIDRPTIPMEPKLPDPTLHRQVA